MRTRFTEVPTMNKEDAIEVSPNLILFPLTDIEKTEDIHYRFRIERINRNECLVCIINHNNDQLSPNKKVKIRTFYDGFNRGSDNPVLEKFTEIIYRHRKYSDEREALYSISSKVNSYFSGPYAVDDEVEKDESDDGITVDNVIRFNEEYYQEHQNTIQEKAKQIFYSNNPMKLIIKELDNIICGEVKNKGFAFVTALSAKSNYKLMLIALEEAGAGKTWLFENIAGLFRCWNPSHISKKALNYIGEQLVEKGVEILYVKEFGNMDQEGSDIGNAAIKMLSMDDNGLSTTYTYRNSKGEFATKSVTTSPITVFSGSTKMKLESQTSRRVFILSPDTSPSLTQDIKKWKTRNELQKTQVRLGQREITDLELSRLILRELVQLYEPVEIEIPFLNTVFDFLSDNKLRTRGDTDRLMWLLKYYGILQKNNLPRYETEEGRIIYCLTPEFALEMLDLSIDTLMYMSGDSTQRDFKLLAALEHLNYKPYESHTLNDHEIMGTRFNDIANYIKCTPEQVKYNYLQSFEDKGFVQKVDSKPLKFELLSSVDEIRTQLTGIKRITSDQYEWVREQMHIEADKWFKELGISNPFNAWIYANLSDAELDQWINEFDPSDQVRQK
jgi:hypothetical protein